jgi:hypothetical protein
MPGRSRLRTSPAGADRELLLDALRAHRRALERGEGVLKDEHKTALTRVRCGGRDLVVKHYRYMGLRRFLKGIFCSHPGTRSLRTALAMERRAIPTPPVVGLVERCRAGLVVESWFVTGGVDDALELDRYLVRRFAGRVSAAWRRRLVARFAGSLRALMASGIRHADLKTCNILIVEAGDECGFSFIDLDDVALGREGTPASRRQWVQALAQLNSSTPKVISRSDRLRFLRAIPELDRFERRALVAEVQAISRAKGRRYFSDEGPVELEFV